MSEENRNNFKTYMVKEKDFTNLIIKDKEDNYYYSAIYVNELQQEIERLNKELEKYKYSADELNEIKRLNNIIKEAREYTEEKINIAEKKFVSIPNKFVDIGVLEYILEILDRK